MTRSSRCAFLAVLGLLTLVAPAAAQYYPYPQQGYYPPPPPRGYYRPEPGWGGGYYQRPVEIGNICYTSRGSCRTRPRPVEAPCSCNIPGFGPKRGGVIAGGW